MLFGGSQVALGVILGTPWRSCGALWLLFGDAFGVPGVLFACFWAPLCLLLEGPGWLPWCSRGSPGALLRHPGLLLGAPRGSSSRLSSLFACYVR